MAHSYNTKQKREGAVKTEQPALGARPALRSSLADEIGWPQLMGRLARTI